MTAFVLDERDAGGRRDVVLRGQLRFADAAALWSAIETRVLGAPPGQSVHIDLAGVDVAEGGAVALLVHARRELEERGCATTFVGANATVGTILHLYGGDAKLGPKKRRKPEPLLAQIGRGVMAVVQELLQVLDFVGLMARGAWGVARAPRTANWRETWPIMERAGADAVPIVVLINFLVGFVMAYQGAVQLKQFGANVFVADLVGLSVTRELGPLMTAIILCGRSGAAFAAELGSMRVAEEVDALRTMGFGPIRFLVLPRALALMLVLPVLTLLADVVATGGGLLVGVVSLDLTPRGYLLETQKAVHAWDVFSGCLKSVVFALAIALVACQQGLAASGGAEGVGRRTTSSVVTILFSIIAIDAVFTVLFHVFHL